VRPGHHGLQRTRKVVSPAPGPPPGKAPGQDVQLRLHRLPRYLQRYVHRLRRHDLLRPLFREIRRGGTDVFVRPASEKIEHLGDLNEACGEKDLRAVSQGKSHVRFIESGGKLYFATHIGYYTIKDGMETVGDPPPDYKPYPGGHFLSYDPAARKFENLAVAPTGRGSCR